ncbi:MAG TPA: hypothetical protein VGM51_19395 [Armatimonadota bacterium]|jgi:hypothetical protein
MNTSLKPVTTVICRPGPLWITSAALLALLGGFFLFIPTLAPHPVDDPALTAIGFIALSLSAMETLFCATSSVVADEHGLRWRRFGFGRSVPWSGVLEYHLQDTQGAARKPFLIIRTDAGRLVVPDLWTHQADLKALLAARALDVLEDEWGVLTSGGTSQRVFEYDERRLALARWAAIVGTALYVGLVFHRVLAKLAGILQDLGLLMMCGFLILVLVLAAGIAAFVYCGFIIAIKDGLRRRTERITVDPDGIAFEDGERSLRANWEDVQGVRLVPVGRMAYGKKRVIVTPDGEFEYTRMIRDAMRLDAIIKRFAVNARYTSDAEGDVIGPDGGSAGVHVYHYRTYTSRALLMFPLGFVLIAVVIGVLQAQGLAVQRDRLAPWIIGLGSFAVWAWCLWRYRTVSIRTDSLGVTQTTPSGKTFIAWSDISSSRRVGSDVMQFWVIKGSRATIRFWLGISNASTLVEEIRSHGELAQSA